MKNKELKNLIITAQAIYSKNLNNAVFKNKMLGYKHVLRLYEERKVSNYEFLNYCIHYLDLDRYTRINHDILQANN